MEAPRLLLLRSPPGFSDYTWTTIPRHLSPMVEETEGKVDLEYKQEITGIYQRAQESDHSLSGTASKARPVSPLSAPNDIETLPITSWQFMKLTLEFDAEFEIQGSHYTSGPPHLVFIVRDSNNNIHINLPPNAALVLARMIEVHANALLLKSS